MQIDPGVLRAVVSLRAQQEFPAGTERRQAARQRQKAGRRVIFRRLVCPLPRDPRASGTATNLVFNHGRVLAASKQIDINSPKQNYFLLERKRPQREAFRHMPVERILIETDSPELSPPPEQNPWPLHESAGGTSLNHPANLAVALKSLASTLDREEEEMAALTTRNWQRLFGPA